MAFRGSSFIGVMMLALTSPAAAQEDSRAAAVSAFDDARRLIQKGQVVEACQKFAESQRLDPQLGTLLHWADCLERNGQTASAWARYRDASELAAARKDRRLALAEARASKLLPRLSKVQVDVDPRNDLESLSVERDKIAVGRALWGTATPTDPGTHSFKATAPGRKAWTGQVVVPADGSTTTIHVPVLEELPIAPVAVPKGAQERKGPEESGGSLARDSRSGEDSWVSRRWPVLVAAGVGLAGVGVGSAFGLKSKQSRDEADDHCDGRQCFDPRGVTLREQAIADGNISTIAFAIGGVGLAAAGVLLFALPGKSEQSVQAGIVLGPATVRLRGTF